MPARVIELPSTRTTKASPNTTSGHDWRYRRLLGEEGWHRLPRTVQDRFTRLLAPQAQIVYRGEVVITELSLAGRLLAQIARLIGGPLPFTHGAGGPSVVVVTEEPALEGQIWTRMYSRPAKFAQVVQSAKRFRGPTGLEEDLGAGLLMRLDVVEAEGAIVFRSAGYAVRMLGRSFPLPHWLSPGRCEVRHQAETDARFSFTLTLDHALLGRLLRQVAFYEDETSSGRV